MSEQMCVACGFPITSSASDYCPELHRDFYECFKAMRVDRDRLRAKVARLSDSEQQLQAENERLRSVIQRTIRRIEGSSSFLVADLREALDAAREEEW